MSIEKLKEEYNTRKSIRDSFDLLKIELEALKENPQVQRYIELIRFYEHFKSIENKTDEELLDQLIKGDTSLDRDIYFHYGDTYYGYPKKIGGYYIVDPDPYLPEIPYIKVAKYRNIKNENDIKAIPLLEQERFESTHSILQSHTDNKDEEYYNIRKSFYKKYLTNKEPERRF